jgi:Derlin-2/3
LFCFFHLFFFIFFLRIQYGSRLEKNSFANRPADFLTFILFIAFFLTVIKTNLLTHFFFDFFFFVFVLQIGGLFFEFFILGTPLITSIIYVWSKREPSIQMSFMFGLRFQSLWFPWVLLAFTVLMGGSPFPELMGILVGHLYFFLKDIYPRTSGVDLIQTPKIL